jgi:hypothetical protein
MKQLETFGNNFGNVKLEFFGSYLWLIFPLKWVFGIKFANILNSYLEKFFPSRKNAFKFILIAEDLIK